MRRGAARLAHVGVAALLAACTEQVSAPAVCPAYCPTGSLTVVDTVLRTAITRDSSYGRPIGYVNPYAAPQLLAANLPSVRDSRPIFSTVALAPRMTVGTGTDTTTGAVIGVDSLWVRLVITRRDTATHNLALSLYLLPLGIDSTTTFAALAGPFASPPIRVVNVDTLVKRAGGGSGHDGTTGDSIVVDTLGKRMTLLLRLDSAQAPYSAPDSGKLALGIRVGADSLASIALGGFAGGVGPGVTWFFKVDSLGHGVVHRALTPVTAFNSFVFTPPPAALDRRLAVGGVPATRTILRVAFPRTIRDSSQIIRATLVLIPAVAPQGVPADSFGIVAQAAVADFGAKSPLLLIPVDTTRLHIGTTDTVRIEVTNIMRLWAADTLTPTTLVLRQTPEGADIAEIRFYASVDSTLRPVLHITYAAPFPFGKQ
jgi:hypothetical protein